MSQVSGSHVGGSGIPMRSPAEPGALRLDGVWAAVWVGLAAALAAPAMRSGVFDAMSTDDAMRLVEVRDLIAGQAWYDLTQYRLDPPAGILMHWSRLIDAPLAGLVLLLRPLLGQPLAEAVTAGLWPILLLGAALALVARTGFQLGGRNAALAALVVAGAAMPALVHFRSGAIDHHNVQTVLVLGMALAAMRIERGVNACLAGVCAIACLAVGLEMLPALLVIGAVVAGFFVQRGRAMARPVAIFGASITLTAAGLALALVGWRALANPVCDSFGGPVLLLAMGGGLAILLPACLVSRLPARIGRFAACTGIATLFALAFVLLYPGCLHSPYGTLDPRLQADWLGLVPEAFSILDMMAYLPSEIPGTFGLPVLALLCGAAMIRRAAPADLMAWTVALAALAAHVAVSLWQLRGAGAAALSAAPVLAAALAAFVAARPQWGRHHLVAAAFLVPATLVVGLGTTVTLALDRMAPARTTLTRPSKPACQAMSSVAPLAALPPGRVMSFIDLGSFILAATPHSTFAAPYHRDVDGNLALLDVMLGNPAAARSILSARNVTYLALCSGAPEQVDYGRKSPDGLAARLARGERFDFLEPLVPATGPGDLSVWRVVPR